MIPNSDHGRTIFIPFRLWLDHQLFAQVYPLLVVLIYGIAEASTAYLITKITNPPPDPQHAEDFKKEDIHWSNKHEFVSLPLDAIDKLNTTLKEKKAETLDHRSLIPSIKR